MAHEIKVHRSRRMAAFFPRAEAAIESSISPELIERLTAAELAEVRRCLNAHWHKAVAFATADILGEGAIWDARRGKLREIA